MKAIKVRIYPSPRQAKLFEQHFGCCRLVYNWGLEQKTAFYVSNKKSLPKYDLINKLPELKETKPFLCDIASQSLQQTIIDLESAFSHFFKRTGNSPRFKSRKNPKQSYRIPQGFEISRDRKAIKMPKARWIKLKDKFNIPKDIEFKNVTISRDGNEYFAAICYEEKIVRPDLKPIRENKTLGIDLGVKTLATLSDGTKIENPKHFKKYENKLALEKQKLSKIINKDFKSYQKQKERVKKVYNKIRNTRKDFLHKLTTSLVDNQDWTSYAMEDLAVKQAMQDNFTSMSKAIGDAGWRMLRTMMEYKCEDSGKNLLTIGRFEPSSKTCNICGHIYQELGREETEWICSSCKTKHDRDWNAAKNIKQFGLKARASALVQT